MLRLLASLFLALPLAPCFAADWPIAAVKEAKSAEEIRKTFGTQVGFGPVNSAEFRSHGRELLAIWYCPTSGEAQCYMHCWYFDPAKTRWILLLDTMIPDTHDLAVELTVKSDELVFRDLEGNVVRRQSVEKVPAKEWQKK